MAKEVPEIGDDLEPRGAKLVARPYSSFPVSELITFVPSPKHDVNAECYPWRTRMRNELAVQAFGWAAMVTVITETVLPINRARAAS